MASLLANSARKLKPGSLPVVWVLTDESRMRDPGAALIGLPRKTAVILRHYGAAGRAELAARLSCLCRARGLSLFIALDWRLAAKLGAAGLHLPEFAAKRGPCAGARLWLKRRRALLSVAAHGSRSLARARRIGADAALLAPVFATRSHPGQAPLGPVRAAALARAARVPVVALGGASPEMMVHLRAAGFIGVAGIGFAAKAGA